MIKNVIIVFLMSSVVVSAQERYRSQQLPIVTVPSCIDQFKDLPLIAERLGVKEGDFVSGSMILGMCDGRKYDFIKLINALLDKMDKANK